MKFKEFGQPDKEGVIEEALKKQTGIDSVGTPYPDQELNKEAMTMLQEQINEAHAFFKKYQEDMDDTEEGTPEYETARKFRDEARAKIEKNLEEMQIRPSQN